MVMIWRFEWCAKAVAIATGGAAGGGLPDPFRVVWGRSDTPTALTVLLLLERYAVM